MPRKPDDTVKSEVLYPDSLSGETFELLSGPDSNGALEVYHAEDDAEWLPDGAKRGWWLPVDSAEHGEVWAAAPRELREAVMELAPGDIIEVLSCEKGPGETDPWMVETAVVTDA